MARRKSNIDAEVAELGIKVLLLRRQVLSLQQEIEKDLVTRLEEKNNVIMDDAAQEIKRLRKLIKEVVCELELSDDVFDYTLYDKLKKELRNE